MRVTKKRRGTATDVDGREGRREREKKGKREIARAAGRTEKRWRQSRGNEVESDVSYE